jgi:hypothetical protein
MAMLTEMSKKKINKFIITNNMTDSTAQNDLNGESVNEDRPIISGYRVYFWQCET